ncbi:MAG TPA: branched-chain amino acid ABC transporter substrate-binding protein [Gaiellaceae bacterium]|nr:branched-chain amino acid ABC transporter substrate-binding protein [Gaiellaceae bacterium]
MRIRVVSLLALTGCLALVAAGCGGGGGGATTASGGGTTSSASGGGGCDATVSIGMLAPITGPAASIGSDQLHWAEFFVKQWNADSSNSPKLKIVQGDTQLDPAKASTVSQQFASNKSIVAVIGPAGSDEVQAVASILKKAGLAFLSGSATRVSLTDGTYAGYFFRDVPNDSVQGPTDVQFMLSELGVKKGDTVMVVDDQEAYSTGLADIVQQGLKAKGVTVDRESVSQKATDFSSLVGKVDSSTKVVFLPFQVASEAQLFAQQLKAGGKSAVVFGSDGTFDSSKFKAPGSYISFFAPDVTTLPDAKQTVDAFHQDYPGATSPFGAPNYVAARAVAEAISRACQNGSATRSSVREALADTDLSSTLLGQPLRFTDNGDVQGAKFHIFKIQPDGSYKTVQ